jgi:hypothetical protein
MHAVVMAMLERSTSFGVARIAIVDIKTIQREKCGWLLEDLYHSKAQPFCHVDQVPRVTHCNTRH